MRARHGRLTVMLVGALVLVACGDAGDTPAEPTATVPSTPELSLEIGGLTWASSAAPESGAPVDDLVALPNDAEQVVAALSVPALPAGTRLQANWTIDGDPLPALQPEPVVVDEPLEEAWVSWELTWSTSEPWPIGELGIVIEIDGEPAVDDRIQIVRGGS